MLENLTPLNLAAVLLIGASAGFINVLAGGGSALTIPLMIFLGYDATVAKYCKLFYSISDEFCLDTFRDFMFSACLL